jgi:urease accessory protein
VRETDSGDGAVQVHLVGGAAGPLSGDVQHLRLEVGAGAALRVRSVAASFAMPGPCPLASLADVEADVADGGALDWWPQPMVSVRGSAHRVNVRLAATGSSRLRWVDELVLGRHGEDGGIVTLVHRVQIDGIVVLAQEVAFGEDQPSAGEHGRPRVVVTAVVHEPGRATWPAGEVIVRPGIRAVRAPIAAGTTSWTVLAPESSAAVAALAELGLRR